MFFKVEVLIDNVEESQDMIYEVEEIEADKEEIREVTNFWMKMEEEEVDPLSVPLLVPHQLAFTPPDYDSTTFNPIVPMPVVSAHAGNGSNSDIRLQIFCS